MMFTYRPSDIFMPHIPKAFCVGCFEEMKPHLIGHQILTQTQEGRDYYKISTDLFRCPSCLNVIALTDRYTSPVMHHQEGFDAISEHMTVRFR